MLFILREGASVRYAAESVLSSTYSNDIAYLSFFPKGWMISQTATYPISSFQRESETQNIMKVDGSFIPLRSCARHFIHSNQIVDPEKLRLQQSDAREICEKGSEAKHNAP